MVSLPENSHSLQVDADIVCLQEIEVAGCVLDS